MGLFDIYSDVMKKVGETMQRADPFGPMGAAGEAVASFFTASDIVGDHGFDVAQDLANNAGDILGMLRIADKTPIIQAGLKIVLSMQYQCGWTNEPTKGDGYSESAQRFNDISDTLSSAMPDDSWAGSASDAYRAANELQRLRAKKMVDADLDVRMALSAEAGEVDNTRRILNNAATMMGNAILPALAARAIPRIGKAVSLEIETAVVGVSLPTCIWYMNQLSEHSTRAAHSIQKAAELYEEIAAAGYPTQM